MALVFPPSPASSIAAAAPAVSQPKQMKKVVASLSLVHRICSCCGGGSGSSQSGRRELLLAGSLLLAALPALPSPSLGVPAASSDAPQFYDLLGLKVLDIRQGSGRSPLPGDKVEIHYFARLAAKQGWRFDSTYDHKDRTGAAEPYAFTIGSGTVIEGLDLAVQTMKEGGVRRVIIPPSKGYQNTSQGPIPPNVFDRQRLYTTIFNPTRLANGEGSTLGTLIFDIELLGIRTRTDLPN